MKVLTLNNDIFNIQKCLLPDCDFLQKYCGSYFIVTIDSVRKTLVRIGLSEIKNMKETLFLDESVSLNISNTKKTNLDVSFEDFKVIGKPSSAQNIKVIVVFSDYLSIKKYSDENLSKVVKDILKLYVFSSNCVISLNNLQTYQKFGIDCILIQTVSNSKSAKIFRVDSNTEVCIEKCITKLKFEQNNKQTNHVRAGGCSRVYSVLKETFEFSKTKQQVKFVNKLLLIGPSGCGKTILIKNVASDCKCLLLEISPSSINALTPERMKTKVNSIFEEAKLYVEDGDGCVILIEDIDLMSSGKTLHAKQFVSVLITLLENVGPGVVVIATTNSPDDVDPQLRKPKRLEDELEIMVPTSEERMEILKIILEECGGAVEEELLFDVSSWTPGFVGADLQLLVVEALLIFNKSNVADGNLRDSFKQALTKVIPSALKGAIGLCTSNNITFLQIGGLEDIKKVLDLSIKQQLKNPEKFQRFGIPLTKGLLLYGPPGCAKTTLVKALANECNTTFLATSAADLYSPYVGDAEKTLVNLFMQARVGSPSILFIDEIDAVVGSKSGDRERGVQERILSTLLIEMDGVGVKVHTPKDNSLSILGENAQRNPASSGVIVIGATNRPQLLDDALKRPGRFDRLLYVPPPDESERYGILKKLTENIPLHESVDLKRLAQLTEYYSGADLKNLCQEAGLHALRCTQMTALCVEQSHFDDVLRTYKPSLNEKVVSFYESFQKFNVWC